MTSEQITVNMDELRDLVRQMVVEVLEDLVDGSDPDVGKTLTPEVVEYLKRHQHEKPTGIPIEDVIKSLGLDGE